MDRTVGQINIFTLMTEKEALEVELKVKEVLSDRYTVIRRFYMVKGFETTKEVENGEVKS